MAAVVMVARMSSSSQPGNSSAQGSGTAIKETQPSIVLRGILLAGKPVRSLVAAYLWAGHSVFQLASVLARGLLLLAGWLNGRVSQRKLLQLERSFFPLRRWHIGLASLAAGKAVHWSYNLWREIVSGKYKRRRELLTAMRRAGEYTEWSQAAEEVEELEGMGAKRRCQLESRLYDRRLVQERRSYLTRVRERGEVGEVMFVLRADLLRNLGNMANPELQEHFPTMPPPIQEYIQEVQACLNHVTHSHDLPLEDKLNFLREVRHAFGRTALVLSGGGSFGSFHMGVVKALLDTKLLPRVISGSSAGSIVSAMISTRTDDELVELFDCLPDMEGIDFYFNNTPAALLKHLLAKGTLQDHKVLQERLQRLLGDITFAEAYQRTGRILNIAVTAADTSEPPRLLNYLTSPNVLIWSAVACSSAFPLLFLPQDLMARDNKGRVVRFAWQGAVEMQRRWRDGSLEEDLPMRGLSEMFNVNYFLVSQCNPYLLPIVAFKQALPGKLGTLVEGEFKHRCKQLMDILPHCLAASRLLKLLNQPWAGDVNMILPAAAFGTLKSVINLTKEDLLLAIQLGQQSVWGKLSAISANCAIEVTMDNCLRQVTAQAAKQRRRMTRRAAAAEGGKGLRRGLPSWVHMPGMGMPWQESFDTGMTPTHSLEALGRNASACMEGYGAAGELPRSSLHHPPQGPVTSPFAVDGGGRVGHDLTTTWVPEGEGEGEEGHPGSTVEEVGEEDEEGEEVAPLREPQFERGRGVWKDLFSLTPAARNMSSQALDVIAP